MRLPTQKLARGARLYHGTSVDEDFSIPNGPAWFSDAEDVAEYFQTWHTGPRPRILPFWVSDSPKLLLVHSDADFRAFEDEHDEELSGCGSGEMAEIVCRAGYDGWIIPNNYPEGADIMLCDPERWLTTEAPTPRRGRRKTS